MDPRPLLLVSNDDGIHSAGLAALEAALSSVGEVVVVAPDREQSACSHALTLHRPLRIDCIGDSRFVVDGTPTDCINLAINGILKRRPALVVSGINRGANLGDDITYSGTVSAAMEGTLLGVPSIAVSLIDRATFDFGVAASFAARLASWVLTNGLPADTLLNVNVPQEFEGASPLRRRDRREARSAGPEVLLDRRRGRAVRGGRGDRLPRRPPGAHLGHAHPPRPDELSHPRRARARAGHVAVAGRRRACLATA